MSKTPEQTRVATRVPTLGSVGNAMRALKAFSSTEPEWGVSDLARHLGIGKSTVHRLLATMVAERMLEQDQRSGRYRLGLAVFDLAAAVPTQLGLHEAVTAPMSELHHRSGEAVQVAVLDGRNVVYLERLDSPDTLRMFLGIGRHNHAHCTATGKLLLAYLPRVELDRRLQGWELPRVTKHTIVDRYRLRDDLGTIRARGWSENVQESQLGTMSLAVPIRSASSDVIAALSLAGPTARIVGARGLLLRALSETAALVSRRLGFRGVA